MKENADAWRSWLPPEETKCPVGNQRLLNEALPGGIECVECAAGFFSSGGLVSECTACAPGVRATFALAEAVWRVGPQGG